MNAYFKEPLIKLMSNFVEIICFFPSPFGLQYIVPLLVQTFSLPKACFAKITISSLFFVKDSVIESPDYLRLAIHFQAV